MALKIIDKKSLRREEQAFLMTEVEILVQAKHENVIRLTELYETPRMLFLVMELVTGGELFQRIIKQKSYSEADAQVVMRQIFSGVAYLHSRGIVHRDLKPENVLLASDAPDAAIKIADFGLSHIIERTADQHGLKTMCGSPEYVAPEVLKGKGYGVEVDNWSCGVILFVMLCGHYPFQDEVQSNLWLKITHARYDFNHRAWAKISVEAKDLITKLLVLDPQQRLTAAQALEHPWLVDQSAPANDLTEVLVDIEHTHTKHTSFKTVAQMVIAMNRFRNLTAEAHESPKLAEEPDLLTQFSEVEGFPEINEDMSQA